MAQRRRRMENGKRDLKIPVLSLSELKLPLFQKVMKQFFDEHDLVTMYDNYGWHQPPSPPNRFESALIFYDDSEDIGGPETWVGFALLTYNPTVPSRAEIILGVRPLAQGKGYRRSILMQSSHWAFTVKDADEAIVEVFACNQNQVEKYLRDSEAGFPFRYSGHIFYPEIEERYLFTRVKE